MHFFKWFPRNTETNPFLPHTRWCGCFYWAKVNCSSCMPVDDGSPCFVVCGHEYLILCFHPPVQSACRPDHFNHSLLFLYRTTCWTCWLWKHKRNIRLVREGSAGMILAAGTHSSHLFAPFLIGMRAAKPISRNDFVVHDSRWWWVGGCWTIEEEGPVVLIWYVCGGIL